MHGSAQPEEGFPPASGEETTAGSSRSSVVGAAGAGREKANGSRGLDEVELDSALQLLVERAQYITGATGTALALPQGDEMVCRASAGSSAPPVGARLQVRSGLTGESIVRRQLLRCDNAEADPRVNLETCRALGIASIVVLPLLRPNGEVRGLFELFSDHPYAFEERDLIALERMAGLTLTALDLAEQRQSSPSAPRPEPAKAAESPAQSAIQPSAATPVHTDVAKKPVPPAGLSTSLSPDFSPAPAASLPAERAAVPEALLRVQKCASCGFPVSEGRTICLDCEKKEAERQAGKITSGGQESAISSSAAMNEKMIEEPVPAFLANVVPAQESWLSNHVNLLAIIVVILGILVVIVVFR
jgi:putative methionine-R-sulfoxide reductase with GAF domain